MGHEREEQPSDVGANASYLAPYLRAAERHGAGFPTLLWASPATQAARFNAITRLANLAGQSLLDVGCGRADLLDFLLAKGVRPHEYIGIEAVDVLAAEAERRHSQRGPDRVPARIVRADIIRDPARLFVGADAVVLSGTLNTADDARFYETLGRAFDATADALVFNFLASPSLAASGDLYWRNPADVRRFACGLSADVRSLDGYLDGDCTVMVRKPDAVRRTAG